MEILSVLGAFFLYVAVFPLLGAIVCIFWGILLPYLLGTIFSTLYFGPQINTISIAISFGWALLVFAVRILQMQERNWYRGHYSALAIVFSFGFLAKSSKVNATYNLDDVASSMEA